jgi:eukaryotic-like serine/threonine-protein kinase
MNQNRHKRSTLVGTVLEGRYRIDSLIGEGGMGVVYGAVKLPLNNPVAVKVLARDLTTETQTLRRFHREAQIMCSLGHPHIVQVFDFGATSTGQPFLVMELLKGEDLFRRLRRLGRPPLRETLHIVRQVASALSAAHAQDIVHRDLKPANIFILEAAGETDFVKVLDFGISKVHSQDTRLTRDAIRMGTPKYMSPEQAQGCVDEIDSRTDQWALACIVWEILGGRSPFGGHDDNALLYQVANVEPSALPCTALGFRPEVEQVLRRALTKQKQGRFPNIIEFVLALECAAFEPGLELRPPNMTSHVLAIPPTIRVPDVAVSPAGVSPATMFSQVAGKIRRTMDNLHVKPPVASSAAFPLSDATPDACNAIPGQTQAFLAR